MTNYVSLYASPFRSAIQITLVELVFMYKRQSWEGHHGLVRFVYIKLPGLTRAFLMVIRTFLNIILLFEYKLQNWESSG